MNFKEELSSNQKFVNDVLKRYITESNVLENKLCDSMNYSLLAGGKRIRPILILSTYKLFKDDSDRCIPYFVAMEMVHNFSLIHDDLPAIDNDDFRHGKPTNHKAYGESTAILAGDALLNYAYIVMSEDIRKEYDDSKLVILNEFSKEVNNMIKGEYVDTECENKDVSLDVLEYIHNNKTGALIKEAVRIGAILAKASDEDLEVLTRYAENIGLAFQIKDDLLSELGDEKVMGKPAHNDVRENKSTFVTKYGIQKSQEILDNITNEAISILDKKYGDKAWFLIELAKYIRDREK